MPPPRKISFTLAEQAAVAGAINGESSVATETALRSLLRKMEQAREPLPSSPGQILSPKDFLEALGEVFKPHQMTWSQNDGAYAKMAGQLRTLGWTREDVVALARYVKGWWRKGPVNAHTLLARGHEWLAAAKGAQQAASEVLVHSLFEEDDEQ